MRDEIYAMFQLRIENIDNLEQVIAEQTTLCGDKNLKLELLAIERLINYWEASYGTAPFNIDKFDVVIVSPFELGVSHIGFDTIPVGHMIQFSDPVDDDNSEMESGRIMQIYYLPQPLGIQFAIYIYTNSYDEPTKCILNGGEEMEPLEELLEIQDRVRGFILSNMHNMGWYELPVDGQLEF